MKVRELRDLLVEFDQDAEVRINAVFDPEEVSTDSLNVFDIMDIDINVEGDEVILEIG